MNNPIHLALIAAACAALPLRAAEHVFNKDGIPGYKDTALVPGTQWHIHDPDRPLPPVVVPGKNGGAPADAIVLFDGGDLSAFEASEWKVQDGVIVAAKGHLVTKRSFGDIQLHLEWAGPVENMTPWGNQGNSGINLMGMFEVQIFDSHSTKIYADGGAAAIYGQVPPLANVTLPRGEWQTYDIVFKAPVFDGDKLVKPARVTVFHNGVIVQHDTEILGPTTHRKILPYTPPKAAKQPFAIMGHNCPMKFRNVWVRELNLP